MTPATTLFAFSSITETVLSSELATYIVFVNASTPIALGPFPTFISAILVLFVSLITETVLSSELATYTLSEVTPIAEVPFQLLYHFLSSYYLFH